METLDEGSVHDEDLECYEALRSHALDGKSTSSPLGLGVLLSRGMARWLRTSRAIPATHSPSAKPPGTSHTTSTELVGVLSQMVLAVVG